MNRLLPAQRLPIGCTAFLFCLLGPFVAPMLSPAAAQESTTKQAPRVARESLPPLQNGVAPQTVDQLWASYDPRLEPLDVEVLHQWEQDNVIMKVLRYRIGVFKGQSAMMAAVFGYPQGADKLPGLVQIHGGGQYADHRAVLSNAKRGYATISISWAGRISATGYRVNPADVQLFWDGKTDDPNYRVTTDWGPLDAYHAPCRNPKNQFASVQPETWTLDSVASPRNNPWFLCTLGARRALTFLEQQPQVDADRLGVYGHSMGGKLTVLTAGSDKRVKAAAPSCGGISDRDNDDELYQRTIADDVYLEKIDCPIVFLSPANDFHGRIDDLQTAITEIQSDNFRVTCAPHHNHQDTDDYEVATQIWFDEHLKETRLFPVTPSTQVLLRTSDHVPALEVQPDQSRPVLSVDIYYTQQANTTDGQTDHEHTIARFWHHAPAIKRGTPNKTAWIGKLPLFSTDQPLWVYANVAYAIDETVNGAGYYYGAYSTDRVNISSAMSIVKPSELSAAKVQATCLPSSLIESFDPTDGDWQKEWFSYSPEKWPRRTHKVYDPTWAAPQNARLTVQLQASDANVLVVGIDKFVAEVPINADTDWQSIVLSPADFQDADGNELTHWQGIKELRLGDQERLKGKEGFRNVGKPWQGAPPKLRNLKWIPAND